MNEIYDRTVRLIGEDALNRLKNSHVCLFGLGGVGGAAFEALLRAGIGKITVFDGDRIAKSNINRQILATLKNVGIPKTEAAFLRAKEINPDVEVIENFVFYLPENADSFDFSEYDYIIDAVDTVTAKKEIILRAKKQNIPVISCMGTGNKLCASGFEVSDLFKTSMCPLAKVMRHELSREGVKNLKVVYSKEEPKKPICEDKRAPSSISFVPPTAGYILAGEVICDLIGR